MNSSLDTIAATYDCGTYGGKSYDNNSCSTTSSTTSSGSSGVLTNTGFDILLAATLACVNIFIALVVRLRLRRVLKPPSWQNTVGKASSINIVNNRPTKKQIEKLAQQIKHDQATVSPAEKRVKINMGFKQADKKMAQTPQPRRRGK
jgi:uncharacterized membrane protein YhiD involved in acid resistance